MLIPSLNTNHTHILFAELIRIKIKGNQLRAIPRASVSFVKIERTTIEREHATFQSVETAELFPQPRYCNIGITCIIFNFALVTM